MGKATIEIEKEVRALIATVLKVPEEKVVATKSIADLSEDSIKLFELLLAFEKHYKMETVYEDIISLETVQDIIDYIARAVYRP